MVQEKKVKPLFARARPRYTHITHYHGKVSGCEEAARSWSSVLIFLLSFTIMTDEVQRAATSIEENGGDTIRTRPGKEGGRTRGKRGRGDRSEVERKKEVVVEGGEREVKELRKNFSRLIVSPMLSKEVDDFDCATVVIGDRKGRVGFGNKQSGRSTAGYSKSGKRQKRTLSPFPWSMGQSRIKYKMKFKSAKIPINASQIRDQESLQEVQNAKIADLAGIEDLLGKKMLMN